jgi:hypothetical protein
MSLSNDSENKYGGHNGHTAWQKIRTGLSINLVETNMGDALKHRQAAQQDLDEIRKRCVARAHQCVEFTAEREYLDTFPLERVLQAIKAIDRHELKEALTLKTPKGFADRLINSHKFENAW